MEQTISSILSQKNVMNYTFEIFDNGLGMNKVDLPTVEEIGHAMVEKKEFAEGYVVLAGLDLITRKSLSDINEVNFDVIEKAIAFHFSNKKDYIDIWFNYLLENKKFLVAVAVAVSIVIVTASIVIVTTTK